MNHIKTAEANLKRQGLIITIPQLQDLIVNLSQQLTDVMCITESGYGKHKFQINIINKTPECSDTWEIEDDSFEGVKK